MALLAGRRTPSTHTTSTAAIAAAFLPVRDRNPTIFFEPKRLYRASVQEVPTGDFVLPLGEAEVITEGSDITCVRTTNACHPTT